MEGNQDRAQALHEETSESLQAEDLSCKLTLMQTFAIHADEMLSCKMHGQIKLPNSKKNFIKGLMQ